MAKYETREGPVASATAWVGLTTFGGMSLGTVATGGYTSIKEIWVTHQPDGAATDTKGNVILLELRGSGIKHSPSRWVVGAWGNEQTGSSSISGGYTSRKIPVNVALNPGQQFDVRAAQFTDSDAGSPEVQVTVVMTNEAGEDNYYLVRNLSAGAGAFAVDTKYELTGDGFDTSQGALTVPPGCDSINLITAAFGGLTIATAAGGTTLLRLEGDLVEGDQVIPVSGLAGLSTTTGVTDAYAPAFVLPTSIKVKAGGKIRCYMEQTGVAEPTTAQLAIGLGFGRSSGASMKYIMREGPLNTTGDIEAMLSTEGSNTSPGTLLVPSGKSRIKHLIAVFGDNTPTGADKNAGILVRLAGKGMVEEQMLAVGGYWAVFTTAGDSGFGQIPAMVFDVDMEVKPNEPISIYSMQALGVDLGVPECAIGLGFA